MPSVPLLSRLYGGAAGFHAIVSISFEEGSTRLSQAICIGVFSVVGSSSSQSQRVHTATICTENVKI